MSILSQMTAYSKAITSGKIPACQKHRWACERFLRDLDRRGKWQWAFDEAKAADYIGWMRRFKHRKGELADQPKEPTPYEIFVYGNIYGWVDAKTGARRFRMMYEQLARKQAKSQDKAIQALYEMTLFGENEAEIYVAATKKDQARYVWEEAEWLINKCGLKEYFSCKWDNALTQKIIKHLKSGSIFARLSKEDAKKGDGSNPHFAIIDEYHQHETDEYREMFLSGMKTRKNPLLAIITTAGVNLNYPCFRDEYKYVSQLLNHDIPVEDDRYFAIVCELDRNETTEVIKTADGREIEPGGIIDEIGTDIAIQKSNPVTGYSGAVRENILIQTERAKNKPEEMRNLLTKTYNIWVNDRPMGYINMTRWAACKVDEAELQSAIKEKAAGRCYIGIDMSDKIDLTSVGFIFPFDVDGNKHYALVSHSFMPEEKFLENKDNVPYDVWRKGGHLTVTDGSVINARAVIAWVVNKIEENGWSPAMVCFDSYQAMTLSPIIEEVGLTPVLVKQWIKYMTTPTKDFREAVYARRIMYSDNPLLSWAMGNATTETDSYQNFRVKKPKPNSKERVDPVAAILTAFTQASVAAPETPHYEPSAEYMFV
jgi:phage terminase large subunit-like protein